MAASDHSAGWRALAPALGLLLLTLSGASAAPAGPPAERPNIVVLLVDDAALMDLGAFGGEAHTPNIDRLAARGAMFTGYHTSPLCAPSRAMLLTGVDNHRAGVATIEEVIPPSQRGKHGYGLHFEPGVLTVADRLRSAGYRTLMAGKWHLGHGDGQLPNSHGFDRSLALDASGADNWAAKPYMPYYADAPWFEDGAPAHLPDSYYSSDLLVDRMIGYLDQGPPGAQPFFAYLAFQAVHIPVQAPRAYSDHYRGRYDAGWAEIRRQRAERARQLGLIPADAPVQDMPSFARSWSSLSAADRRIYARSMEVYSGMLEAMDASIGRLVDRLAKRGELDHTVFVVTSDNGPEPSDPVHAPGMGFWMTQHGYDWTLDHLGERGSLGFIGTEWAAALSSPGDLFKFYAAEGGIHVPLIIAGPGVPSGARVASSAFVTDLTPTILDFAHAPPAPASSVSVDGRSLRPVLEGAAAQTHDALEPVGIEVSGNSALFRGSWKIVRNMPPYGDGRWRLFDMATDPGETRDRSGDQPAIFRSMLADYAAYERRAGVQPLPAGYSSTAQVASNALERQIGFALPWLGALAAGGVAAGLGGLWLTRRRRRG